MNPEQWAAERGLSDFKLYLQPSLEGETGAHFIAEYRRGSRFTCACLAGSIRTEEQAYAELERGLR